MRLYNTRTRSVDDLVPREPGRVGLYVCGPTVYDVPHFGHARAAIVPDVLRRHLQDAGLQVLHVRNITDVDDKIIDRAAAAGQHPAAVAEEFSRAYEEQMAALRILPPHIVPRATGHIGEMVALIVRLIARGHAYAARSDVWFAVRTFEAYGALSGRKIDDLRSGARVTPDEAKRDPLDFALWKGAKAGEPSWPSPWGPGRPGWHIECSAMASTYLGDDFDIHAGGLDLVFPHHENEIAQSEAATGRPFARHWVHNGMVEIDGEKMSKSLGNFVTLAEAVADHGPDVVRALSLSVHYRSPVAYTREALEAAAAGLDRWRAFLRATAVLAPADATEESAATVAAARAALDEDLATPTVHALLHELTSAGNTHLTAGRTAQAAALRAALLRVSGVLGYALDTAADAAGAVGPLVEVVLALRQEARATKDWAAADRLRDALAAAGVVAEDGPDGVRWHLRS